MLAQSVNHVTLDTSPSPTKSERDSVGFWKGWCGARDYCPFAMVVRVAVFGATGGASKARVLAIFEE